MVFTFKKVGLFWEVWNKIKDVNLRRVVEIAIMTWKNFHWFCEQMLLYFSGYQ